MKTLPINFQSQPQLQYSSTQLKLILKSQSTHYLTITKRNLHNSLNKNNIFTEQNNL